MHKNDTTADKQALKDPLQQKSSASEWLAKVASSSPLTSEHPDNQDNQSYAIDLLTFHLDYLLASGDLQEAGRLLEKELPRFPQSLPLLLRLGRLDEAVGQYFNAFDLYRQIEHLAVTDLEREQLEKAVKQVKAKLNGKVFYEPGGLKIRLEGNSTPLELHYKLDQLLKRRALFQAVLDHIDRRAESVLEIECATGLITRNLALHGFKTEGLSGSMEEIILALGFESYEALQAKDSYTPNYHHLEFSPAVAENIEPTDVILIMPEDYSWYLKKGEKEAAELILRLAKKASYQLFFYLPPGEKASDKVLQRQAILEILQVKKTGSTFDLEPVCSREPLSGQLYVINLAQQNSGRAPAKGHRERQGVTSAQGEKGSGLPETYPRGLKITAGRSAAGEVDLDKCRTRDGQGIAGAGQAILKGPANTDGASALNADRHSGSGPVQVFVPAAGLLPWEGKTGEKPLKKTGAQQTCSAEEVKQAYYLIKEYGYRPEVFPGSFIRGYFLKKGRSYRFIVTGGLAFLFAAAACGYRQVKCKLDPCFTLPVSESGLKMWPGVSNQLYTENEALSTFKAFFDRAERGAERL